MLPYKPQTTAEQRAQFEALSPEVCISHAPLAFQPTASAEKIRNYCLYCVYSIFALKPLYKLTPK